eukprot:scaffold2273_cov135-Cylindrotheca_fusiformis.AAC.2
MGRKKLACQTIDDENTDVSCFESSENCQLSGFDREKRILGEGCAGTAPCSEAYVRVCTEQWQEAKCLIAILRQSFQVYTPLFINSGFGLRQIFNSIGLALNPTEKPFVYHVPVE